MAIATRIDGFLWFDQFSWVLTDYLLFIIETKKFIFRKMLMFHSPFSSKIYNGVPHTSRNGGPIARGY